MGGEGAEKITPEQEQVVDSEAEQTEPETKTETQAKEQTPNT